MATVDIDIRANVDRALRSINSLIGGFKALAGAAALKFLVDNITEAEDAAAQLDAAFKATGKTLGLTRDRLDDLATEIQQTTKFSDDLVKEAESVLLTFNRVRGEAFERTIKSAADLSARLGIDLVSASRLLGKALQDPVRGLTQLQRSGITFSESQKELIQNLAETGRRAEAQNLILAEVEKRYKGAAAAARNTLSGALTGLKNAFGDLFEGTKESISPGVKAINDLAKTLGDPKIKEDIDNLIHGLASILAAAIKLGSIGVRAISAFVKALEPGEGTEKDKLLARITNLKVQIEQLSQGFNKAELAEKVKELAALQSKLDRLDNRGGPSSRGRPKPTGPSEEDLEDERIRKLNEVAEVEIKLRRKIVDENQKVLDELDEQTRTSQEKQIAEYEKTAASLKTLLDEGVISKSQFDERLDEALNTLLPEIDIGEIKSKYKQIEQQSSETAAIVKGAFEQAGASIQSTLSEAIQNGKLSFRSLVDVARKAFADIASALIVSGIKKFLLGAIGGVASGSSSGLSESFLASTFAPKASGGLIPQGNSAVVGEEGREIVTALPGGGLKVFNKRQQMSGGSTVVYSPTTNVQIIERENSEQTKQEVFRAIEIRSAKDKEELYRRLAKNGVPLR